MGKWQEILVGSESMQSFVHYESIKRELHRRLIYEYRCDEGLKTKNEEATRLAHTGLEKFDTILDFCVSSFRRDHPNLLCIIPIRTLFIMNR